MPRLFLSLSLSFVDRIIVIRGQQDFGTALTELCALGSGQAETQDRCVPVPCLFPVLLSPVPPSPCGIQFSILAPQVLAPSLAPSQFPGLTPGPLFRPLFRPRFLAGGAKPGREKGWGWGWGGGGATIICPVRRSVSHSVSPSVSQSVSQSTSRGAREGVARVGAAAGLGGPGARADSISIRPGAARAGLPFLLCSALCCPVLC
jgi:hypothetical protein